MPRRPLRFTLFPYTTLFRSVEHVGVRLFDLVEQHHGIGLATHRLGDRKSTRLNSSHTVISYAVFCLKKKMARLGLRTMDETIGRGDKLNKITTYSDRKSTRT